MAREKVPLQRLHVKRLLLRARHGLNLVDDFARRVRLFLDRAILRHFDLAGPKAALRLHHRILGHVALLVIDENKVLVLFKMQLVGCLMMRFTRIFTWYLGLGGDANAICMLLGTGQVLRCRM